MNVSYSEIKDESYESIKGYLNTIDSISDLSNPISFIIIDGIKYFVNYTGDGVYGIINEKNNKLVLNVVKDTDGNINYVETNGYHYSFDTEDNVFVKSSENKIQLLSMFKDDYDRNVMIYHEGINNNKLFYNYYISGYDNPNVVVNYLNSRTPDLIQLKLYKLFLLKNKNYLLIDNNYIKSLKMGHYEIITSYRKKYSKDEIMKIISDNGFDNIIPDDLIKFYSGDNKDINNLILSANIYKKINHIK